MCAGKCPLLTAVLSFVPAPEGSDGSHLRLLPGDQRATAGSHRGRQKRQREGSEGIRPGLP